MPARVTAARKAAAAKGARTRRANAKLAKRAEEIGKALGRGRPVSKEIAKAVAREWRQLSGNPRVLTWVAGFQEREAKRTGRLPTVAEVRRNPEFRRALDVVFANGKGKKTLSRKANGPLARALVNLGVRDPDLEWDVGSYVVVNGSYQRRAP